MHKVELKYKKKVLTRLIPSSWNELSMRQVRFAARLMLKKTSVFNFCLFSLIKFLRIPHRWLRCIDGETMYILSEKTHFLLEENTFTVNLFPVLKIKGRRYYGPASNLYDITLIEYAKAETRFIKYSETNDRKYLNELIAILWRPRKFFFFKRYKYDDRFINNADSISRLPEDITFSIFLFFYGCRNYIIQSFPHVFIKTEDDATTENFGWAGLINDLAGTKFGDIDKTSDTYLYTILLYLEQCAMREIENRKK